jgi:rare lipoprotein A
MVMGFKIKYLFLIFLLTTSLWSISKKDRIIRASLHPYTVKGITYYPHKVSIGETKSGILASWYGEYFHGRKTANGEIYDMHGNTAAHKTYPLGTVLLVTNPKNYKSIEVKINDRGPFWNERELDLSMGAAEYLEVKEQGVAKVDIEVISVPLIALSFEPVKGKVPLKPTYNVGYTATSYSTIRKSTKIVPIEISTFLTKKEAKKYLKKLKKYQPKAVIFEDNYNYKIRFFLASRQEIVNKRLKKLRKIGLFTGYGVCWSYD